MQIVYINSLMHLKIHEHTYMTESGVVVVGIVATVTQKAGGTSQKLDVNTQKRWFGKSISCQRWPN